MIFAIITHWWLYFYMFFNSLWFLLKAHKFFFASVNLNQHLQQFLLLWSKKNIQHVDSTDDCINFLVIWNVKWIIKDNNVLMCVNLNIDTYIAAWLSQAICNLHQEFILVNFKALLLSWRINWKKSYFTLMMLKLTDLIEFKCNQT